MSRTRVRYRRLEATALAAGVLALGVGPVGHALAPDEQSRVAGHTYVVRPGDTLWSIAAGLRDGDPRPLVDAIQRANEVDPGALVPGQALVIPAAD